MGAPLPKKHVQCPNCGLVHHKVNQTLRMQPHLHHHPVQSLPAATLHREVGSAKIGVQVKHHHPPQGHLNQAHREGNEKVSFHCIPFCYTEVLNSICWSGNSPTKVVSKSWEHATSIEWSEPATAATSRSACSECSAVKEELVDMKRMIAAQQLEMDTLRQLVESMRSSSMTTPPSGPSTADAQTFTPIGSPVSVPCAVSLPVISCPSSPSPDVPSPNGHDQAASQPFQQFPVWIIPHVCHPPPFPTSRMSQHCLQCQAWSHPHPSLLRCSPSILASS